MNKRRVLEAQGFTSFLSSLLSILAGLLIGFLLLIAFNSQHAFNGMARMLTLGIDFSNRAQIGAQILGKMGKVLYQAAPLLMTGLSVGFAFKTGLFNIGASGQYTIGAACAIIAAIAFKLPWYACIIAAMLGGAVWGAIPGLCKALFNVNEVITSIMFNWIGLFAVNLTLANIPIVLANAWGASNMDRTADIKKANPSAIIPTLGLNKLFGSNYMNISIFLAIFIAIVIYIVLNKTTFGYELKSCGANKNASIYAGISAKRNIVLSMVIAGGLSGIAGGMSYLAGTVQYVLERTLLPMGFDGIPVALLGTSHPLGTIFSALFISYIKDGGNAMQPEFSTENINIIISVIIYLAAFALLTRNLLSKALSRRDKLSKGNGAYKSAVSGSSEDEAQSADAVLRPDADTDEKTSAANAPPDEDWQIGASKGRQVDV